ncbi:MAG: Gfo/Idh/MocA family oxidoreductase [Caldilineaceae bacterium SB0668_bin_21]|nr:Gfo/Idh/MocA family oxidoreductase [Caldilineaceae bacterium SB0668_bin_21]MYC21192.1 Gfo/Idh/MocA family oxidoreductase [Caldilineaceae bacterium SB0662_bin_25]
MFPDLQPGDYQPDLPSDLGYGIGFIGCGNIVLRSQMPAYKRAGYRVVACCDKTVEKAHNIAANFDNPLVTAYAEELLLHPDVQIVDLAVHAYQRLPLVEKIAAAGKHIFSQKPLAPSLGEAERIVEICRDAGVTLMVNQQARWAPPHRALRLLVEQGVLGHVYSVTHFHRAYQDYGWYAEHEDFNIVDHGIHYVDLSRYFSGHTPLRVKATTTMAPGQNAVSPMIYTILFEYEEPAQVMTTLHFNNIVSVPALHDHLWFLDGTRGSALLSNPMGTAKLSVSLKDSPEQVQTYEIAGTWGYEGFAGSMGEMLRAMAEGREPECTGRDNLESIRMAVAAVESSNSGESVELGR